MEDIIGELKKIEKVFDAQADLVRSLKNMVTVFNTDDIDPLKAFATIEQAKEALKKAGVRL